MLGRAYPSGTPSWAVPGRSFECRVWSAAVHWIRPGGGDVRITFGGWSGLSECHPSWAGLGRFSQCRVWEVAVHPGLPGRHPSTAASRSLAFPWRGCSCSSRDRAPRRAADSRGRTACSPTGFGPTDTSGPRPRSGSLPWRRFGRGWPGRSEPASFGTTAGRRSHCLPSAP